MAVRKLKFTSSNLATGAYNKNTMDLLIRFKSGGEGYYNPVPANIVDNLMAAPSQGKYFHHAIKSKYKWTPLPKKSPVTKTE